MSFPIMIIIMLLGGVIGGIVNYLLPANNPEPNKYLKPWATCIVLGIGATLLVPLFLAFAQSKLMDNIHFGYAWQTPPGHSNPADHKLVPDTMVIKTVYDTATKLTKADTSTKKATKPEAASPVLPAGEGTGSGKDYLLWAAYCLLAAAAGFRFINMLINNVVKEGETNLLKNKVNNLEEKKILDDKQNQMNAVKDEHKAIEKFVISAADGNETFTNRKTEKLIIPVIPVLPPVTVKDDPQKNRFGGKAENNGRALMAKVDESKVPEFYDVNFWVEGTKDHPLASEVIFYIHDSFRPSVFTFTFDEITQAGGVAKDHVLAYGAFTIGAITDNGQTMLELDLAENKGYPAKFRSR
ncbi:MAG: YEATS-associated helix-containing protein [Chitinophagaceae bacterium]